MRAIVFLGTLLGGIALAVVSYFVLTTPINWTSEVGSNPRVPFGAGLFVIGVLTTFSSAVVYELLPERQRK